jgi:hypothetical protein
LVDLFEIYDDGGTCKLYILMELPYQNKKKTISVKPLNLVFASQFNSTFCHDSLSTKRLNSFILSSMNCLFLTFSAPFFGFFKIYP